MHVTSFIATVAVGRPVASPTRPRATSQGRSRPGRSPR
jgi:hypothetical protein